VTQTQVQTDVDISCWPPVSHIIHRKDMPPKEGTVALCGAKLMGIDLQGNVRKASCKKCLEIMRRELKQR
jgi:hypothetical protein